MHRPLVSRSRPGFLVLAVAGLVLSTAGSVRAGTIVVSVQSVSALQGTSGNSLEVDVQNTGAPVDIAAFSFEITVAAGSGVSFTGADFSTATNTYIFAGNSAQGPNIATPSGSPSILDASDNATSGSTTLGTNSTLALGRVFFDVASSAPPGPVTVFLTPYPSTSLTGPNLNDIPVDTLTNGAITILTQNVVPEPAALVSATLGLLAGTWLVRTMRRSDE
jgi:hypothetical protein